jgi:hypothetical protein
MIELMSRARGNDDGLKLLLAHFMQARQELQSEKPHWQKMAAKLNEVRRAIRKRFNLCYSARASGKSA